MRGDVIIKFNYTMLAAVSLDKLSYFNALTFQILSDTYLIVEYKNGTK